MMTVSFQTHGIQIFDTCLESFSPPMMPVTNEGLAWDSRS